MKMPGHSSGRSAVRFGAHFVTAYSCLLGVGRACCRDLRQRGHCDQLEDNFANASIVPALPLVLDHFLKRRSGGFKRFPKVLFDKLSFFAVVGCRSTFSVFETRFASALSDFEAVARLAHGLGIAGSERRSELLEAYGSVGLEISLHCTLNSEFHHLENPMYHHPFERDAFLGETVVGRPWSQLAAVRPG